MEIPVSFQLPANPSAYIKNSFNLIGKLPFFRKISHRGLRNSQYMLKDLLVVGMTPVFPLASIVFLPIHIYSEATHYSHLGR